MIVVMISAINRTKKGFTLIELLTVLGIMVIIGGISLPLLAQIRTRQSLKKAAQQLLTCLDTARSFALSRYGQYDGQYDGRYDQYGVEFNISADRFFIFKREKKGETEEDKQIEKTYKLPSSIKFKSITGATDAIRITKIVFLSDGSLDLGDEKFEIEIQDKKNKTRKIIIPKVTGIGRIQR